jgi:DNA-binding NarL/FixJ family response regulator
MHFFVTVSKPTLLMVRAPKAARHCISSGSGGLERLKVSALRILVADDHDLVRRGVKTLLEMRPGWHVCGEARNGHEAVLKCQELKPHIAILDFNMPELNGLEAAKRILKLSPPVETLLMSVDHSNQLIRDLLNAGVRGYILKSDSDRDLVSAVEALENHRPFFAICATELMLNAKRGNNEFSAGAGNWEEPLTSRELELLQLIAEGKNSREAASVLGISTKTADTHRANLMRKLQIHSVTDLVRYALRNHIVAP